MNRSIFEEAQDIDFKIQRYRTYILNISDLSLFIFGVSSALLKEPELEIIGTIKKYYEDKLEKLENQFDKL